MSYFRSYFEKNNTIIKNSQANTAKNPTTEIFYGSAFSKFLFKVDFTDLKNKVNCEVYFVLIDNQNKLIVLLKLKDNDKKKIQVAEDFFWVTS